MNLKEVLTKEIIQAMKDKNTIKKSLLQNLKASIQNMEIEKGRELTDTEEISLVQREVKQTEESRDYAISQNRTDLVKVDELKLEILKEYLPKQLTTEEVVKKVKELGITSDMNMGQAMKLAMAELQGQVDNKTISLVIKDILK